MSPKRLNRKRLIQEIEELREGFRALRDLEPLSKSGKFSADAYHRQADQMVVELGGESVRR